MNIPIITRQQLEIINRKIAVYRPITSTEFILKKSRL